MTEEAHPYERLTPDLVMDCVESAGYRCDARNIPLNSYENRVYQIGVEDDEPVIGKFYRPGRWSDDQILEEHRFTQELEELEIPVVPPLLLPNDSTLAQHEGFRFALYARRGGRAPQVDDMETLPILGRFIGRIHSVGSDSSFQHRPTLSVAAFGHDSRTFLLENDFIPAELITPYETLTAQLLERIEEMFQQFDFVKALRLHGDCHMGNVLWRDQIPHFVDFDDARNGPAIQDLWMLLSGERDTQILQIQKIVEGYSDFCDFDPVELNLVEPLRTLRIMHHSSWLAKRWSDPAFPRAFPWFNSQRYWSEHILELREQMAALYEPALSMY
jgi:Ser/Thr protein kinase RdoA (MazF antagonist)|tara:strand:+ start:649 stop:1638 length:990 start_codon:yes stop_codon:yes gene_type:complete